MKRKFLFFKIINFMSLITKITIKSTNYHCESRNSRSKAERRGVNVLRGLGRKNTGSDGIGLTCFGLGKRSLQLDNVFYDHSMANISSHELSKSFENFSSESESETVEFGALSSHTSTSHWYPQQKVPLVMRAKISILRMMMAFVRHNHAVDLVQKLP